MSSGKIAVMYDGMVTSLPMMKAGNLKACALASKDAIAAAAAGANLPRLAFRTSTSTTGLVFLFQPWCLQT